jgi:hypothetical protein
LKHATTCKALQAHDVQLWEEAVKASGQGSLGANLDEAVAVEESSEQPQSKRQKVQSSLDIKNLRETGKKVKEEQRKLFQSKVDHIIMRLICVRGLIPNLIDSPEWKELMGVLNSIYHPTSADIFADKHIPREAVYIRQQQIDNLRSINNLTLTFDGNTTRKPHSIYTVHATTPSRDTYFLDAHEGSDERHTADWIENKVLKVCGALY